MQKFRYDRPHSQDVTRRSHILAFDALRSNEQSLPIFHLQKVSI